MGRETEISWCDHTFNLVWGCTKIAPECKFCYAAEWAARFGVGWGPAAPRRTFGEKHWREPLAWDRAARRDGVRRRVFCSSMADVFEDHPTVDAERAKLWGLIRETPNLDWLLLTKRPGRMADVIAEMDRGVREVDPDSGGFRGLWPNVWCGTSAGCQETADGSLPDLVRLHGVVTLLFVSSEPLLSAVDLSPWIDRLSWVIGGGESGAAARPCYPEWAWGLRDQCVAAGVAFHWKQWGEWVPDGQAMPYLVDAIGGRGSHAARALFPDGSHLPDLAGRGTNGDGAVVVRKVGKKGAGRQLDGQVWDQMPGPAGVPR